MASAASAANPITLGINAGFSVLSLGMHLLAAHDERITIAKEENAAVQQAVATMDNDLQTIFKAANAGEITAQEAALACSDVSMWYWQFITPLQQGAIKGNQCRTKFPANTSCYNAPGTPCDGKTCTAGCCIGCNAIDPTLANAVKIFQAGGGTLTACVVIGNKYGLSTRQPYSLTYKQPKTIVQAELTINSKTGVVSVGAPPSAQDVVVATGKVNSNAVPDQGGVVPVSALNATETGPSQISSLLGGTGGSSLYLIIGVALLVLLVLLRGTAQPQVVYAAPVGR